MADQLKKVERLHREFPNLNIQVDGGIKVRIWEAIFFGGTNSYKITREFSRLEALCNWQPKLGLTLLCLEVASTWLLTPRSPFKICDKLFPNALICKHGFKVG